MMAVASMRPRTGAFAYATFLVSVFATVLVAAEPPIDLGDQHASTPGAPNYANAAVTLPDGTIESFFRRSADGSVSIFVMRSTDNGRSWTTPEPLVRLAIEPWGGPMPLLDRHGELHFVIPRVRGDGRRPNVDRFIDLYHLKSSRQRTEWSEPRRIYEGYCGALQGVFQLSSGRIVAPFADWLPNVPTAPPTGPSVTTCVYSDDDGGTWQRSPAKLTAPCHENYNGGNYGACEPTLIELNDGRVWMLIRTQDGFLYESFSNDGTRWSEARRSRFYSSNSPAFPVRLPDGRIVVFWNNCEMPPRVDGDGVYGGRDALHAAISDDEGRTWRGFREVYRDATRNGSPPRNGDRGTAYPHATVTQDGKILLVSGQGTDRRRRFLIDPDWLLQTTQCDAFRDLDAWHVFKGIGPARRWWRDRVAGPQLAAHPDRPEARVLHVRRANELEPDGAVWNFPAGVQGRLAVRLRANAGFGGARISLTDRMFDPCDDAGDELAAYSLALPSDGRLQAGHWHRIQFDWKAESCQVTLDGESLRSLKPLHAMPNGLSYLRLRSAAAEIDPAGFFVESVEVEIGSPE